jgi:hypothetical protein
MAFTAQQLIARSWYLSGIEARELQSIDGDRMTVGLDLLNSLLNFKQGETDLIPYFKYDSTNSTVIGQEKYSLTNWADIKALSFNLGTVRYKMTYVDNNQYFSQVRVNNIQSLPFTYTFIRENGGISLYLYYIPDQVYTLNIFGKKYLSDVTLATDLSLTFDKVYIEYLRYALADYMCQEYGVEMPPRQQRILSSYTKKLKSFSPPDVTVATAGLNMGGGATGWTFIQFFQGYVP